MHHLTEFLVNFSTIHFIVIIRLSHKLIPFLGINYKDKCIILIFALQWQLTLMEGLKVHLSHNVMEKSRKICSIYDQRAITDWQVQNWFTKFYSGKISSEDEPRQRHSLESLKSLVESNLQ